MEPTAAWGGPFELQVATSWIAEEPAEADAQVWDPAVGLPLQYGSTFEEAAAADGAQVWTPAVGGHPLEYASSIVDIFGSSSSCSLQPYNYYAVPASSSCSTGGQQQLVEYNYYAAAAQHDDGCPIEKATDLDMMNKKMQDYMDNPPLLFEQTDDKFNVDARLMKRKMHRYPPIIRDLDDWCTVPRVVAIGPYYHRREHLQKAETLKHVAAHQCIRKYRSVNKKWPLDREVPKELYQVVVSAAEHSAKLGENQWVKACDLYDKDGMAGIRYNEDFLPMMFYDACFLVMYMLKMSGADGDPALFDFFESSDEDIAHDIMLLENQIPWPVVEAVMDRCVSVASETKRKFIARWKHQYCLQDRISVGDLPEVDLDDPSYGPVPHLLGLLRFHMVGKGRRSMTKLTDSDRKKIDSISISAGAIELAEMGMFLRANKTRELPDMGVTRNYRIIFAKLSMAPLTLDDQRASMLVNMAALELCTTPDFLDADEVKVKPQDSAVCSYLLLLCMLMHREEDVHKLRENGILKGAGLSNNQALVFFTSLESLRKGRCYYDVMVQIEHYRVTRWPGWLTVWAFLYNNGKYIFATLSAIGGFIGVIKTLMDLKSGK